MDENKIKVLYVDDEVLNLEIFERLFSSQTDLSLAQTTEEAKNILQKKTIHVLIVAQKVADEPGLDFIRRINEDYPNCAKVILTSYSQRNQLRQAFQAHQIMDFIFKPIEEEQLLDIFRRGYKLYQKNTQFEFKTNLGENNEIVGAQKGLSGMMHKLQKVAKSASDSTVLICGESGTGKELVARALHYNSARKKGPFIAVNCAALPDTLWESELFGHERGAFSNAIARKLGRFELAHKGTIFLDEIAEIPNSLQVKLLRVLQERCFERLGGTQKVNIDIQVIAATNRELEKEVREGRFREDLYFRLNVIPINVPALRDHAQDIPELLNHFLKCANRKCGKRCTIQRSTISQLQSYPWPGNIRELKNLVERAVIFSENDELDFSDFMTTQSHTNPRPPMLRVVPSSKSGTHKDMDSNNADESDRLSFRKKIKNEKIEEYKITLRNAGGNISEAARNMGIHPRTLSDRLRKMQLI